MKEDSFSGQVAECFETGVAECFLPLAQKAGLPLIKIYDGVYDIVGHNYRLRIRRGIGHGGGFLITLSNEEVDHRDPIKIVNEIGLSRVAGYNGAAPGGASIPMRDNSLSATVRLPRSPRTTLCLIYWELSRTMNKYSAEKGRARKIRR
jgi:hypothetical protein